MQRPVVELAIMGGAALAVNGLRALGEADGDTVCENIRQWAVEHPYGEEIVTGVLFGSAWLFHRHLFRRLHRNGR